MKAALRIFVFVFVFLAGAAPARAQVTRDPAAAEALFLAGRDAIERGDYATACARFAESDRLDPAPGTRINLADCEEHTGHPAAAWRHWREALELLPQDDARLPLVRERVGVIEKRVPKLTIKLERAAPGVRVMRDDIEIGVASLGVALPLEPGEHVITVTATDRETTTTTVSIMEGMSSMVVAPLGPLVARTPAPAIEPPAPPAKPFPYRTTGFILAGVGGVALATSAVSGALALVAKSDLSRRCFPTNVCNDEGADAAARGRTSATLSTVTGIAGAVLLAGGVVLVLSHPREASQARAWLTIGTGQAFVGGTFE